MMNTENICSQLKKQKTVCKLRQDCTKCKFCLDKTKYGGPNKLKQKCIEKTLCVECTPTRKRKQSNINNDDDLMPRKKQKTSDKSSQAQNTKQTPKSSLKSKPGRRLKPKPVKKSRQVSVEQICFFLGLVEYPVVISPLFITNYAKFEDFETYYKPLVSNVNPGAFSRALDSLVAAKWHEIFVLQAPDRPTIMNRPFNGKISVMNF